LPLPVPLLLPLLLLLQLLMLLYSRLGTYKIPTVSNAQLFHDYKAVSKCLLSKRAKKSVANLAQAFGRK
jgi:hypothetical protein